jgi:hypothetical protein
MSPKLILEYLINYLLVSSSSILRYEWHCSIAINSLFNYKGCFFLIIMVHGNLMIPKIGIQEAQIFKTCSVINQTVNLGEKITIFWANFVQICEVNTHLSFVVAFFYHHYIR